MAEEKMNELSLKGNEAVEQEIRAYAQSPDHKHLNAVLAALLARMKEEGEFLFPVKEAQQESGYYLQEIASPDGRHWFAGFTSQEEFEKGEKSPAMTFELCKVLETCMHSKVSGLVINPWGQGFRLDERLIQALFAELGKEDYRVPEDMLTEELLRDGEYLKNAAAITARNSSRNNYLRLMRILRDSTVWVPCTAIMSEADQQAMERAIQETEGNPEALIGETFTAKEEIRMVPDILEKEGKYFFPVFTAREEMGEYGENFSKVEMHFLKAASLALHNEKPVTGIVINAWTQALIIPKELFPLIEKIPSSLNDAGL